VNCDALIFDLDGTLWDAAEASAEGWNAAAARSGSVVRVSTDAIRSVSGKPTPECFRILLPELCPMPVEVAGVFDDCERDAVERLGGTLYAGVPQGLPRLAARYRLFLVSNCLDWYLDAFFRVSGLRSCFTGWDCHGLSAVEKPAMIRRLVARHSLAHPLYVGDTRGDQEAARRAGIGFVFARYGFGEVTGDPLAFDSFAELAAYFLSI
jgi:phosphoglycolate phosphatase